MKNIEGPNRKSLKTKAVAVKELPKARVSGPIRIGDIEVDCYVLEDETRLISQRGLQKAIGMSEGGGKTGERRIVSLVAENYDKWRNQAKSAARIDATKLAAALSSPVIFRLPKGGAIGYGYEATVLAQRVAVLSLND